MQGDEPAGPVRAAQGFLVGQAMRTLSTSPDSVELQACRTIVIGRRALLPAMVAGLLCAQVGALVWSASRQSPTYDEVGHFAAGIANWRFGRFRFYRVNPPLVRLIATAPATPVRKPDVKWSGSMASRR